MKPLSEMTDDELLAAHSAAASGGADLSHMSDDDLKKAYASASQQPQEGPVSAAISGLAHGLTFNQSDKIIAAARAGYGAAAGEGKLGELYDKYLNEGLDRSQKLAADNPVSYTGAELGSAVINPANRFLPGGSLAKNIVTGAGIGALSATGQSATHPLDSYEGLKKFGSEALSGAESGALGGVAGTALGAVVENTPSLLKKGASVMMGAPEESVGRYIANPEAVMNAPSVVEQVGKTKGQIADLKNLVMEGSQSSRQDLTDEGTRKFFGSEIGNFFLDAAQKIKDKSEGVLTPAEEATVNYLEAQAAPWVQKTTAPKQFTGERVKDLIQQIDRNTNWDALPGSFAKPDEAIIKGVRSAMDQELKQNPQYAATMADVAKKTNLLNDAQGLFASDQGLANTLNRVRRDRAPFAEDIFNRLDQEFGTKTVEDMRNALARESFAKGANGPGGSRMVNMYRGILSDWAHRNNIPFGDAIGGVVGGTMDKYGPGMAKKGIDAYRGVAMNPYVQNYAQGLQNTAKAIGVKPNLTPAMAQYFTDKDQSEEKGWGDFSKMTVEQRVTSAPESLGAYATPLKAAFDRGPQALAAAHYVLSQKDPNYQMMFQGEEAEQ